jgi:hypothetical protein
MDAGSIGSLGRGEASLVELADDRRDDSADDSFVNHLKPARAVTRSLHHNGDILVREQLL